MNIVLFAIYIYMKIIENKLKLNCSSFQIISIGQHPKTFWL